MKKQNIQDYGRTDPTNIDDFDIPVVVVATCAICLEEIQQPILKGIWYHKWSVDDEHVPVVANPLILLFLGNSKSRESRHMGGDYPKCKKHERYWNEFLGFKKIRKGWRDGHYWNENYISLCGRVMDLKRRKHELPIKIPESIYENACVICIKKYRKEIGKLGLRINTPSDSKKWKISHTATG